MRLLVLLLVCSILSPFCTYSKTRIVWDDSSIMKIDSCIDYSRLRFLSDGKMAVVYRHQLGCKMKIYNNMRQCTYEKIVFPNRYLFNQETGKSAYVLMANPELIELKTGRLLFVCNYRPLKGHAYPFSIASVYSDDKGTTWSEPIIVYSADSLYDNGCWEPALLELSDGTVQLYFSNENNFRLTDEQEIDMMESYDGGNSWSSGPQRVAYSSGKRDGMPVPRLYKDTIYVAIEDNTYGRHQPSVIKMAVTDNWTKPVDEYSSSRSSIMKDVFPPQTYGGAPYIAINTKGVQFISCQSSFKRRDGVDYSNLLVLVRENGEIVDLTYPFRIPFNKYGRWGSIELKNDYEIWATISSNFEGNCSPYLIKGKIIYDEK